MQRIAIIAAKTADSRERSELTILWSAASREDRQRSAISLWS